jgi:hypothetical protein
MYSYYITVRLSGLQLGESHKMAVISALRENVETLPTSPQGDDAKAPNPVLIHVRFRPDGSIGHITDLPAHLSAYEWFTLLCSGMGDKYHAHAGGRGFFRTTRRELESIGAQPQ